MQSASSSWYHFFKHLVEFVDNETHQRILDAADTLFSQRGYADVTLRDIGRASGIHHSSLYYYAPGGKEQLYIDVMVRNLARHHAGLTQALQTSDDDLRARLIAVGEWFLSQPVLDITRMLHSDVRGLPSEQISRLIAQVYALHQPIVALLQNAAEVRFPDPDMAAFVFVSMVEGLHAVPAGQSNMPPTAALERLVDLLLFGLRGQ